MENNYVTNLKDIQQNQLKESKTLGKILIAVTGGLAVGLSIVCGPFITPALRKYCLPYVPATPRQIRNILSLIPKNHNGKLLDVGSGDGRIVIGRLKS